MLNYITSLPSEKFASTWPRRVAVLGSTGSIGKNSLSVIANEPERFKVIGLAGGYNVKLLAEQARHWKPACLGVADEKGASALREALAAENNYNPQIFVGQAGYAEMAALPELDLLLSAQSGAAGLNATYAAARAGKVIALANKESLVLAGGILRELCQASGAAILPVDSEHNAIFQCLCGQNGAGFAAESGAALKRIILTASGGPFFGKSAKELASVGKAEALNHPTWNMGVKITIDSATLMNKGLEYVEACYLFALRPEQVKVIVHPQSVIHSLIEYQDNSHLAQLGVPDMRIPISCCLGWPRRLSSGAAELDLTRQSLSFVEPDQEAFPALAYWQEAHREGRGLCIALNAANEVAVDLFVKERISFLGITRLARLVMDNWKESAEAASLEDVFGMDEKARALAMQLSKTLTR